MHAEKKKSILIIDDENEVLESLMEIILQWDYTVVVAQTLPAALIKINNQKFNVILLDIMLKKVSGLKILDLIRRNHMSMNHDTPVILHSGHIDPNIIQCHKGEFNDALVKPAEMSVIKEKIDLWETKKHYSPSARITYVQDYVQNKLANRNKLTSA
jgi:CheY-like chemotaxis protein